MMADKLFIVFARFLQAEEKNEELLKPI